MFSERFDRVSKSLRCSVLAEPFLYYGGFQNAHSVWVRNVIYGILFENRADTFCPMYHFAPVSPMQKHQSDHRVIGQGNI